VRRSLLVILIVAVLSAWISRMERPAEATPYETDWVRTADGWQSRTVLAARTSVQPLALHPGLVAAFQLGASLFVLLAIPANVSAVASPARSALAPPHGRRERGRLGVDRRVVAG
jgi:hypothetical protein